MLVKWKILCSFGLVFWSTMCAIDYVFGNIINKGEFSIIQEMPFDDEEETIGYTGWRQIAIWGMCSFAASFLLCAMLKLLRPLFRYKYSEEPVVIEPERINPRMTANASGIDIKFEQAIPEKDKNNSAPNINLLQAVKDFPVTTENSENTRLVEKRCTKLKEEMREMQMSTWKEYSSLNKKLDGLSKEKADLGRQLLQAHRDNKQLKQQLDDIIGDRTLLIKRLECATKEIKLNTSSKQMTLDKLEEAVLCSNQMRTKVAQLTKEKEEWEAKCRHAEEKYKGLKTQVKITLNNRISGIGNEAVNFETESQFEQSEVDIAKVQNKLMDLEKSLQKMRSKSPLSNIPKVEETGVQAQPSGDVRSESSPDLQESEFGEEKYDKSEKPTSKCGDGLEFEENTMDLSREVSVESGDRNIPTTEEPDDTYDLRTDTSTAGRASESVARATTTSPSNTSTSSSRTENSLLSLEESESDVMYSPGIVSQSPAFQKFLLKVLESPVV